MLLTSDDLLHLTFTFMHLADAFIQSDFVYSYYTFFCQYVCSLGIEPTNFALLMQCSTTEPQEHLNESFMLLVQKFDEIYIFQG